MTIERGRGKIFVWLGFFAAVAIGVILYLLNPSEHGFYPRCFFKMSTGLDCPGCGGLRATHQLLHGNLIAAFKLNPLLICLLPLGAYFGLRQIVFMRTGRLWPQPFRSSRWSMLLAVVVIAFGVLRNLPWSAWFSP